MLIDGGNIDFLQVGLQSPVAAIKAHVAFYDPFLSMIEYFYIKSFHLVQQDEVIILFSSTDLLSIIPQQFYLFSFIQLKEFIKVHDKIIILIK